MRFLFQIIGFLSFAVAIFILVLHLNMYFFETFLWEDIYRPKVEKLLDERCPRQGHPLQSYSTDEMVEMFEGSCVE